MNHDWQNQNIGKKWEKKNTLLEIARKISSDLVRFVDSQRDVENVRISDDLPSDSPSLHIISSHFILGI